MSKYYFVTYESRGKMIEGKEVASLISNVILKNIHPIIWASKQPDEYKKYYTIYILFWQEITEDITTEADGLHFFAIEDEI